MSAWGVGKNDPASLNHIGQACVKCIGDMLVPHIKKNSDLFSWLGPAVGEQSDSEV